MGGIELLHGRGSLPANQRIEELKRLALENREYPEPYLIRMAEELLALGRASQALKVAGRVLRRRPHDVRAIRITALCLFVEGKREEALSLLSMLKSMAPSYVDGLLALMEVARRCGRTATALEAVGRLLELGGGRDVRAVEVELYLDCGRYDEALAAAERLVDGGGLEAGHLFLAARAAEAAGAFERAVAWYRDGVRMDPCSEDGLISYAELLARLGRWKTLHRLVAAHPHSSRRFRKLGSEAALRLGEWDRAALLLERLVREDPSDEEAISMLARLLLNEGRLREASVWLERLAARGTSRSEVYSMLASVKLRRSDPLGALQCLRRAVELDPAEASNMIRAGRLALECGKPVEALAFLKRAMFLEPSNPVLHMLLGRTYGLQGDSAKALYHLSRARSLGGDYLEAWLETAVVLRRTGDAARAVEVLEDLHARLDSASPRMVSLRRRVESELALARAAAVRGRGGAENDAVRSRSALRVVDKIA